MSVFWVAVLLYVSTYYPDRGTIININTRLTRIRRMVTASIGGAAIAGLAFTGLSTPAVAVPGVSATSFDPNSTGSASYRDQSSAGFSSTFARLHKKSILTDLDIDTDAGYRVGSVWQTNTDGRAWTEKRDLTTTQFHDKWTAAKRAGMRLTEQETYLLGGQRRYAGIWVQNKEGDWASHRGQTNAQFKASYASHRKAGLMPVDYDEYETPSGLRFSSVWVKTPRGTSWQLLRGQSSGEFGATFNQLKGSYRMLAFDSLLYGNSQRYAGLWISNNNHRGWTEKRDMSAKTFDNYWHRYSDQGYRMVSYDRYETAKGTRYAGIWRQNSSRPDWSLKTKVDALAASQMATGVPGMSVAIYQDGVPVYLRGFGNADIDGGVWMDSDHVGSIASVSKAVAGVLTFRMMEQDPPALDLADRTRDLVPTMPALQTHTVGDLLANRGCVEHYGEGPSSGYSNTSYSTALSASQQFWNDPLVCAVGQYHYSTHGYTLLGAALESAGDDDIKSLVSTKLTTPFGLGTLQAQTTSGRRMSIYSGTDNELAEPNNDWKVLGGGVESSAHDLGRFGAKLIGGQILSDGSLTKMWTPPNAASNYAYGWSTGTEGGTQVVSKNGAWTGNLAYLRLYPEKGISIAVMANSRDTGASTDNLGKSIGALVRTSVK